MTFSVFIGKQAVGSSELEHGDPPMGVAFGKLKTNSTFEKYRDQVDEDGFVRPDSLIHVFDSSENELNGQATSIQVFAIEGDIDEVVISILGMPSEDYERWFQNHMDAYERQFK